MCVKEEPEHYKLVLNILYIANSVTSITVLEHQLLCLKLWH